MALKDFIRKFTGTRLSNSLGVVSRNYVEPSKFQPQIQVTGITYKAIDKIGQSLSMYMPKVEKRDGTYYENHPLTALYKKPNPNQRGTDFIHLWAMLYEIYGETFWYLAKGETTQRVKEIYLLNPAQVEIVLDGEGEVSGYKLHKNNGEIVPLELEEIIHDKRPNPFNPHRGLSVLERAAVYVDTEINTANFTLNYIKNNASPSGIVTLSEDMDRDTFKQFAQQWREGYEGPQNAGKTAFIRGSQADFVSVGATLKDIDQKITREMAKDDVLMMFDVPKPLLGATDDKGFGRGNIETLKYIFAENKIDPMMNRLDYIYEQISEGFRGEGSIKVCHDSPIPEDKEFDLKKAQTGVNVWLTVNEVRAMQGLEPIEGGDELKAPSNTIELSAKKKTYKVIPKQKEIKKTLEDNPEEFRKSLIDTNKEYERKLKDAISDFADDQKKVVIGNIKATSKSYEDWLFNIKEDSEKLAEILLPLILGLVAAQSKDVTNWISGEEVVMTPVMEAVFKARVFDIAGVTNAETATRLAQTLAEGQANHESLAKLKKRVVAEYDDLQGYRAERIARTESLKASNLTAKEIYRQNGYTQVKWFTNPDACKFCATMQGKKVGVTESFKKVGDSVKIEGGQMDIMYDDIDAPPLHPNCECSIIPVR